MDKNVRRNVVTNEIIELEHLLLERLQYRTERSGIGLTNVSMLPEQELCQNLLVDGNPQAFVELFTITTTLKIDPTPKEDEEAGILNPIAEAQKTLKRKETLSSLSENLAAAELASRIEDHEKVFEANSGTGEIFEKTCYFEKSIEYYSRSLAAAIKTKNDTQKSQAKFNLGKIYWKMHNSTKAIENYEECLQLARTIKYDKRVVQAAKELLEIYWHCAERSRALQDITGSIEYFEKAIMMAEACGNESMGAEAKYNIGMLYAKLRNLEKSLDYQTKYLEYSSQAGNKAGECKARASMAEAFEVCGDVLTAVSHLELYLEAAEDVDLTTQARGHCLLGLLYQRQHERDMAFDQFQRYFALARIIKEPDLLDVARVNIGIVKDVHELYFGASAG
ncbi:uncharacterized protein LOC9644982 [Selaginella moellendorffii]|uniref:uncharacterized protein LOC9644982 n=1 Tax=Selaginella moellendorffii TaxID=88036 RepID=UPI000D1CD019|nr:uncharacterized protein LOC9644982 [Selaginella moellendorffii]XP_024545584.1 uncharacterized protein LOC9644982 [Selaginella moellendorffii]|eukprot:XP_024545583.1 uncharacterized protein LOC9644982 [Selaginella moellendorffii]